jgi:hypothetical protein
MYHAKKISIENTKKNIGRRNVSSAIVVSSTKMIKAGNVTNPLGVSKNQFVMESRISGVNSRFHNVERLYDRPTTRIDENERVLDLSDNTTVDLNGEHITIINLDYNTDEMFGYIDRLDLYDPTLNEISQYPIYHFLQYICTLCSRTDACLTNIQILKEFCMQFSCQINLETL